MSSHWDSPTGTPEPAVVGAEEAAGLVGPAGLPPAETAGITHPDALPPAPDHEMPIGEVKRRALQGIAMLFTRALGLRVVTFGGNLLLARTLAPETFGLFAVVSFVIAIGGFLAHLGMGAALIQRREGVTEEDLRTAFTLGLIVDAVVTAAVVLSAPALVRAYDLAPGNVLAVRALSVTILMGSLTAIPSILLERSLRFKQLSLADLIAQIVYVSVAVALAYRGFGVWCFITATLVSRTVATALINLAVRWRPRLSLSAASAKRLLGFGVPYQVNGLLIQVKDNFVPTFIALASGTAAVGYVNWAVGLATNPLFLLTIVSRVTFPAYARLQHDPVALKRSIEKSIKWIQATVFPGTLMLAALAPEIVKYLYTSKWRPGLPSFYLLSIPVLMATYSTVMVGALYGIGRAKTVLKLTAIWTVAGWGLAVPATLWLGFNGFAAAMAVVSLLSYLSVLEMNKVIKIEFVRTSLRLLAIAAIPAGFVWAMAPVVVQDSVSLAVLGGLGGAIYLGLLYLAGELAEVRTLLRTAVQRA